MTRPGGVGVATLLLLGGAVAGCGQGSGSNAGTQTHSVAKATTAAPHTPTTTSSTHQPPKKPAAPKQTTTTTHPGHGHPPNHKPPKQPSSSSAGGHTKKQSPPSPPPPPGHPETTGGAAKTWTDYSTAGGTKGSTISGHTTIEVSCRLKGYRVPDGNRWWYRISSSPWRGRFYVTADAFYNNGRTAGSLHHTPFVDRSVPRC